MTKAGIIKDTTIELDLDTSALEDLELLSDEIVAPPKPRGYHRTQAKAKPKQTLNAKLRRAKTPEEKKLVRIKNQLSVSKANATKAEKALKELATEAPEVVAPLFDDRGSVAQQVVTMVAQEEQLRIMPNPGPQTDFLASDEDEVFYGGARGGGKTYALILDPLRYIHHPRFTGLLIRRTVPELQDIIAQQKVIYKAVDPKAYFYKQEKLWEFSSGARLFLGYGENTDDLERYRGHSYQWLGMDELPQFPTDAEFNLLKSSVRSPYSDLPTRIRCTGNPGNVGSAWVKEMFIDPAPPNKAHKLEVSFKNPLTNEVQSSTITRKFIPARVWDNPTLLNDASYVATLASLPETMRKQMLEGDWDVADGMAFSEFNRNIHVCEPFKIPYDWVRIRGADWGYQTPFGVYWLAFDGEGTCYVYREFYGKLILADDWAHQVCDLEKEERGLINYGVIDRSTASNRGDTGPTVYETIAKITRERGHAVWRYADQSPNSRKQRKMELHHRLATRKLGNVGKGEEPVIAPRLVIFNTCKNLIRTLPMLPIDKNNPELVDTDVEDHAYDALTYALMSRPISVEQNTRNKFFMQTPQEHVPMDSVFGY